MHRGLISDAIAVLRMAVGMRRYGAGNLVKVALAIIGLVIVSITGYVMTPLDTAAVGLIVALSFLCFCLLQYAITLYRERRPAIDVSFERKYPWISDVPEALTHTRAGDSM